MTPRRWTRLPQYDYGRPGAYFVTTCLRERGHLLGTVAGDSVRLSRYGEIVAAQLRAIEWRFPDVTLDAAIVMPDHVHAIFLLGRRGSGSAEQERARRASPLRTVVGSFTAGSAREINVCSSTVGARLWQRGFYDHVIRDDRDLDRVRTNVLENPRRWTLARHPVPRRDGACPVRPGGVRLARLRVRRDASPFPATPVGTGLAPSVPAACASHAFAWGRGLPRSVPAASDSHAFGWGRGLPVRSGGVRLPRPGGSVVPGHDAGCALCRGGEARG